MSVETKSPQGCWFNMISISPGGLQLRAVDLLVEESLAALRRQFLKLIKSLI